MEDGEWCQERVGTVAGETMVQVCALWESDTQVLELRPRGLAHSVDKGCSDGLAALPLCSVGKVRLCKHRVLGVRVEPQLVGWLA